MGNLIPRPFELSLRTTVATAEGGDLHPRFFSSKQRSPTSYDDDAVYQIIYKGHMKTVGGSKGSSSEQADAGSRNERPCRAWQRGFYTQSCDYIGCWRAFATQLYFAPFTTCCCPLLIASCSPTPYASTIGESGWGLVGPWLCGSQPMRWTGGKKKPPRYHRRRAPGAVLASCGAACLASQRRPPTS